MVHVKRAKLRMAQAGSKSGPDEASNKEEGMY